ncbi:MAG: hypothetical protein DRQ51_01750 [Gammaproteobacteria bacterium]|nr:MAG: hypothetical protein DRQ51_01750 [Gammaproteobacteria bacterium]
MFNTGSPAQGKKFIDRIKHLKKFDMFIQNNQHIMIKAPRRFGKTSLVLKLFEQKKYNTIYIDIKKANSLTALSQLIIDEIYSLIGVNGIVLKAQDSIANLFKTLKTTLKIDTKIIQLTIETLEKHQKKQINEVELFLSSLDLVEKIAKKQNLQIKMAFDEFQDILFLSDKSILDKMRSVMQHHQFITYVFLGSIESVMNKIFANKKSAFFHFTRLMDLGGLDIDELSNFVIKFFKKEAIKIDDFIFDLIQYLDGHPYYTMKTLQTVYFNALQNNKKNIDKKDCIIALSNVLLETKPYLDEMIDRIKIKAHHHRVLWYLANNQKDQDISNIMRYKTYVSLENLGYIKKIGRAEYIICDIFLKIYLQQNNDMKLIQQQIDFIGLDYMGNKK